jgi:hypothetical protein
LWREWVENAARVGRLGPFFQKFIARVDDARIDEAPLKFGLAAVTAPVLFHRLEDLIKSGSELGIAVMQQMPQPEKNPTRSVVIFRAIRL